MVCASALQYCYPQQTQLVSASQAYFILHRLQLNQSWLLYVTKSLGSPLQLICHLPSPITLQGFSARIPALPQAAKPHKLSMSSFMPSNSTMWETLTHCLPSSAAYLMCSLGHLGLQLLSIDPKEILPRVFHPNRDEFLLSIAGYFQP